MTGNNQAPFPSSEPPSTRPSGMPRFRIVPGRGLDEKRKVPPLRKPQANSNNVLNRPLTGLRKAAPRSSSLQSNTASNIRSSPNIQKSLDKRRSDTSSVHHPPASDTERVSESLSFFRTICSSAIVADESGSTTKYRVAVDKMLNGLLYQNMSVDSFIDSLSKLFNSTTCFVYASLLNKSIDAIRRSAKKGEIDTARIMLAKVPESMKGLLLSHKDSAKVQGAHRSASNGPPAAATSHVKQSLNLTRFVHRPNKIGASTKMDQNSSRSDWIRKYVHGTEFFDTFLQQYDGNYRENVAAIDNLLWSILNAGTTRMSVEECVHSLQSIAHTPLPLMRSFLNGVLPMVREALQLPEVGLSPLSSKDISVEQGTISQSGTPRRSQELPPFQGKPYTYVKPKAILAPEDIDLGLSNHSDAPENVDNNTHCSNLIETKLRFLEGEKQKYSILQPDDILYRIRQKLDPAIPIDDDALLLISDATENMLTELLNEATNLAEHRLAPLQLNPNYAIADDAKYNMERLVSLRKEIPPKQKLDQIGLEAITRPRVVLVNIHDLHTVVRHNSLLSRSQLIHKLSLCGDIWPTHI